MTSLQPSQPATPRNLITPADAARELLRRRHARDSLLGFTRYTMPGFQAGRHHAQICEALERVERGECPRLMIFAPPRHTKSELASRRFPAWYVGRNPAKQLICATYGQEFADDFGRDVREIVRSEEFTRLFDTQLAPDSTARSKWRTSEGGIYVSVGVDGPATGRGAHVALIDDPFKDRKSAESAANRKAVWDWYRAVLRTRLMPGGAIVLIMTRWHEDDLAGRLLAEAATGGEQWEVISLPAIENGLPLWPEWFGIGELEAIRRTLGPRDWLALYQQQPTAEDGIDFRREDFRYYSDAPRDLNIYIASDFAVTEAARADFTELAVLGVDPLGNVYALDWWYGQKEAPVWIAAIIAMIKHWVGRGLIEFIGENGVIRRAVEPYLRKSMIEERAFVSLEWVTRSADKVATAAPFKALVQNGRFYVPRTEWAERLVDQLLKFPGGKHDDAVDACANFGLRLAEVWAAAPTREPVKPDFAAPLKAADVFQRRPPAQW